MTVWVICATTDDTVTDALITPRFEAMLLAGNIAPGVTRGPVRAHRLAG